VVFQCASAVALTNFVPGRPPWLAPTNTPVPAGGALVTNFSTRLATARYLEKTGQPDQAEPILIGLLAEKVPESIKTVRLVRIGSGGPDGKCLAPRRFNLRPVSRPLAG